MTEDQAKKKWCPFGRFNFPDTPTVAMPHESDIPTRIDALCIGSACMMWRYGAGTAECIPVTDGTPHGYCGLAGKP